MAIPFSTPEENIPDQFLKKAKRLVREEIAIKNSLEEWHSLGDFQTYIVWFSKTLQNWKAFVSTSIPDGRYYEVTYNGDKQEAYIDTYEKVSNRAVKDAN